MAFSSNAQAHLIFKTVSKLSLRDKETETGKKRDRVKESVRARRERDK